MKQVVILSGKGGTGKTSLTAAIAFLASRNCHLVLADADVDAANLEILLDPQVLDETPFQGGFKAAVLPDLCTGCGRCFEICRFGAVLPGEDGGPFRMDPIACEGCNACYHQCPAGAIEISRPVAGTWYRSESSCGMLYHAEMLAGQENSGKLVTTVKNAAAQECERNEQQLLLVDGPPGIGCPVIAACAGADLALISTEPSVSAIHDLSRILETVEHFGISAAVCVNRSDINQVKTEEILEYCRDREVPVLGTIPYDRNVITSMSGGRPVTDAAPDSPAAEAIAVIWDRLNVSL